MSDRLTVSRDIESPPGGWKLTVEQTGVTITAPFFRILHQRVAAHMRANSIPISDDFDEWCADAACRETGCGRPFCNGALEKEISGKLPYLTLAMAKRFIETMSIVIRERRFVPREEAERRAEICRGCELATSIGGCKGCSSVFRRMERALKHDPIPMPPNKEFCGACGCVIRLKVLIPNDILDRAEAERPKYATQCWRNSLDSSIDLTITTP